MSFRVKLDTAIEAARGLSFMAWEGLTTGIVFNPLRPSLRADPHPFYRRLRERDPFHRTRAGDGWVISRYEDVLAVLTDRSLSSDERHLRRWRTFRARGARAGLPDPYAIDLSSMLRRDPPDHTRLRGLVRQAFMPRAVERLRPRLAALVDAQMKSVPTAGTFDLVDDFAAPLPVTVIAELLGIPGDDRERFRHWSDETVRLLGDGTLEDARRGVRAHAELSEYIADVAAQRRAAPRDDLVSALVAAEDRGDTLTSRELVSAVVLLLIAGNETTTKLISNAVIALLRHPEQLALLREAPERIEGAVEELLRFDGPVQLTSRMPTEDRWVCGRPVRRGEQLVLMIAGANRDPEVFEDPDRLDVTRQNVRHLAFGQGLHFCLGAQLARLETTLALEALLTRRPDLAFADAPIEWGTNTILRGPARLPLRT